MLFLLTLLIPTAPACSFRLASGPIITPLDGAFVPAGFTVRGTAFRGSLFAENGDPIVLESLNDEVYRAPTDLPAGAYYLTNSDAEGAQVVWVEVGEADLVAPSFPTDLDVSQDHQIVKEVIKASCRAAKPRRHVFHRVELALPMTNAGGWTAEITERSTGVVQYLAMSDAEAVVSEVVWDGGRVADVDEVCLTVSVLDPFGDVVETEDYPCEVSSGGCSSTGMAASWSLAWLGFLAIMLRRR